MHTIQGSPLDGLYSTLRGIWCPMLLKNVRWSDKLSPKLQQLLTELESTLSSSVSVDNQKSKGGSTSIDINNVSAISDLVDELNFWKDIKDDRRSPYKNMAKAIETALNEIAASNPGYHELDSLEFNAVSELVAKTFDSLNNVWEAGGQEANVKYPKRRMEHLFDCIGGALCRYFQKKLSTNDIWKDSSGDIRMHFLSAIRILDQWVDIPRKLTTTFWRGGVDNPWKGEPYEDTYSVAFMKRLDHVLRIRTLSDELSQLLTAEDRRSFPLERLFKPLEDTRPLAYNPYTEPQWQK